jgi:hypothetical protein
MAPWLARLLDLSVIAVLAITWSMGYGRVAAVGLMTMGLGTSIILLAVMLIAAETYLTLRRSFVSLCRDLIDWQARSDRLVEEFRALGLPLERHYDDLPLYLNRVLHDPSSSAAAKRFAADALAGISHARTGSWIACATQATLLDRAIARYFAEFDAAPGGTARREKTIAA